MREIYMLWLASLKASNHFKYQLLQRFQSAEQIFRTSYTGLCEVGCSARQAEVIIEGKQSIGTVEENYHKIREEGVEMIDLYSDQYPIRLTHIFNPPIVLFTKGDSTLLNEPSIAIVGSRKCSEYGFSVAKKLATALGEYKLVVVSGMARGIDEAGHKGTIASGKTVAVLGTGVNICYPKQNIDLYEHILANGCIVSEYLPNTMAKPYHFPERNRIISGLSLGTVIVEAQEKSGSLITAQIALEQGREVFAVPGNIYSVFSKGTNRLIQEGAKLTMKVEDVLEEIKHQIEGVVIDKKDNNHSSISIGLDKLQIMVYDCLSWQPIQIDKVMSRLDLSIETIEMVLLQLEIKGLIQRLPGRRLVRLK